MNTRERLKNVIYYLMNVNNMNSKVIKNILEYKKFFWQKNLIAEGCLLKITSSGNKYMEIQRNCKEIYNEFSKLYSKTNKSQGNLEIVWGYCFVTWKVKNKNISHPLFLYKCNLEFDEQRDVYILKPTNNKFYTEIEIFKHLSFNCLDKLLQVKYSIEDNFSSIEKLDDIQKAVDIFAKNLKIKMPRLKKINSETVSYKELEMINEVQFYHEPVIIVRDPTVKKWNKEFCNMFKALQDNKYIPYTIKALVDESSLSKAHSEENQWREIGQEPLYALPCNKEQQQIGRKISENFGVVVQGPPGTGKTHSIANLICNLLAHNKKVLVVSNKYNILEKIYNMIPDNIRSLCINYKENNLENLSGIYECVKGIIDKFELNLKQEYEDIERIQNELNLCRRKQENIYKKLEISKNLDDKDIIYLGKKYKIKNIKRWLAKNESQYSWIKDDISDIKKPPITDAKFSKLLYIMSNTSKGEIAEFNEIGGLLYNIPPYYELLEKIKRKCEIQRNYNRYKLTVKDWCISYNYNYDYENILKLLKKTQNFLISIEETWIKNILECAKRGKTIKVVLQQTILKCNYYIKKLGTIKKEISGYSIEVPNDMKKKLVLEKLDDIYKQYDQKGKINKIFRLLHSECEEILQKCTINCKKISNKNETKIVMLYIEESIIQEKLINLWNHSMGEYGGEEIKNVNVEVLTNLEEYIDKIDTIINWNTKVVNKITNSMKEIVFLNKIDWYKKETYSKLQQGVLSIKYISEYESIKSYMGNIEKLLCKIKGFEEISEAIKKNDIVSLKQCYKRIERLKNITPNIREMEYISQNLQKYCPKLIEELIEEKDRVNMLIKYKNLSVAWLWKQLSYTIKEEYNKFKLENINQEIKREKEKEDRLIQKLIVKKSWYNTLSSIKECQKRSLYSYRQAINKLGKACGKNSSEYMSLAQEEVKKFQDFIPVWIMPLDKMIENLNISHNLFDVVIMDEASEMNIFAISALFRAKKAIIFGDENQVNIENAMQDNKKTRVIAKKYLIDIPNWQWINMKTSIYSTALRVFPSTVLLKENLRCSPELINFSNGLCYSKKIITSKIKNSIGELWSPIRTVKVEGKRDKNKAINIKEAEAIVNAISECCNNPLYKGMSMGVISLLGDDQGELIKQLLKKTIGEEEMKNRDIVCGNPYVLQGDERDIVFLSMVIGNNVKFATLTKDADIRRFNVACSRAKKQMWLFHSVELEDMNEECVRFKLLNYCINFKNLNKSGNLRIA